MVGPTHNAKIELQLIISAVQIFEGESEPLTVQGPATVPAPCPNFSCPCPNESHVPEIRITILFVGSMLTGISRDRGFEPTVVHFFSLEVEVTPFNLP